MIRRSFGGDNDDNGVENSNDSGVDDPEMQAAGLKHWTEPADPDEFTSAEEQFAPLWQLGPDDEAELEGWNLEDISANEDSEEVARLAKDRTKKVEKNSFDPALAEKRARANRGNDDPRIAEALRRAADIEAAQSGVEISEEVSDPEPVTETTGRGFDIDPEADFVTQFEETELEVSDDVVQIVDEDPVEFESDEGSDRNLGVATSVGVLLAAAAFALLWINEFTAVALVGIAALFAVAELFDAMSSVGLKPAKLLGYVATVALPAGAFFEGNAAYPLVIGLTVLFGVLWYLIGADYERPVLNLGLTLLGVTWVGGLAGFGGLMLGDNYELGRQVLLAAIAVTALSDICAYFGGKAFGQTPLHRASPSKTWEGTISGLVAALAFGLFLGIVGDFVSEDAAFIFRDKFGAAVVFAGIVGLIAPLGDLGQSMIKRDLGVKDLGTLLPGHGGVFDRVDALLFSLPAAYYVAVFFDLLG